MGLGLGLYLIVEGIWDSPFRVSFSSVWRCVASTLLPFLLKRTCRKRTFISQTQSSFSKTEVPERSFVYLFQRFFIVSRCHLSRWHRNDPCESVRRTRLRRVGGTVTGPEDVLNEGVESCVTSYDPR